MGLKGLEQEVKTAAMHYYYADGDKSKMMDSLLKATTRYLEDGGTTEKLKKIVGGNESEERG